MSPFRLTNLQQINQIVSQYFSDLSIFCFNSSEIESKKRILVTNHLNIIETLEVLVKSEVRHVIQNSVEKLDSKISTLSKIVSDSNIYFNDDFNFVNGQILIQKFNVADDRNKVLEKFFEINNLNLEMVKNQKLFQVASELMMNAQIDAPKFSQNKSVSSSSLIIEQNEDLNLLAISVVDHYGSLDFRKMISKMLNAYQKGFRDSMSEVGHGAGLGAAILYGYVDSLYIGCKPNQTSRVTAILPFGLSEKKIDLIQKSIHIIGEENVKITV